MLLILLFRVSAFTIQEGDTVQGICDPIISAITNYSLSPVYSDYPLFIVLTPFSHRSLLRLHFTNSTNLPPASLYKLSSLSLSIQPKDLLAPPYFILIQCDLLSFYSLSVSQRNPLALIGGIPIQVSLKAYESLELSCQISSLNAHTIKILAYPAIPPQVSISLKDECSACTSIYLWSNAIEYICEPCLLPSKMNIILTASVGTEVTLVVANASSNELLQEGVVTKAAVNSDECKIYWMNVEISTNEFRGSNTIFSGEINIYAGFTDKLSDMNYVDANKRFFIVKRKEKELGDKIFIQVCGISASRYTLAVNFRENSPFFMSDGVPQEGEVGKESNISYFYRVEKRDLLLSVLVMVAYGDANVYAKFCFEFCVITMNDIESHLYLVADKGNSIFQSMDLEYQAKNCPDEHLCGFAVLVISESRTKYNINIYEKSSAIALQAGQPYLITTREADFRFFEYTVISSATSELSITINAIYGAPSVSAAQANYEVSFSSIDQIIYKLPASGNLVGNYKILVSCTFDCYYSVSVTENIAENLNPMLLYPGLPQKESLSEFSSRFYHLDAAYDKNQEIIILFESFSGDFDIFVTNSSICYKNNTPEFQWTSKIKSLGIDKLVISPYDPSFTINSSYVIKVHSLNPNISSYNIQYILDDTTSLLQEDMNTLGQVMKNQYRYYSFPIHNLNQDLVLTLSAISGDPELYISFTSKPSANSYDLKSNTVGSEVLTLLWEDEISVFCPNSLQTHSTCSMTLAISSEYGATYKLKIHPSIDQPKFVKINSAMFGAIKRNCYDFYYSIILTSQPLIILLSSQVGHMDLLINIIDKSKVSDNKATWQRPTELNSMESSKGLMIEEIRLAEIQLKELCEDSCLVLVSVKCTSDLCRFNLDLSQTDVYEISESQPKHGVASRDYQHFLYFCEKDEADLIIIVTGFDACELSLFASKGSQKATQEHYDWSSAFEEKLLIQSSDPYFKGNSMKGAYAISVFSNQDSCAFTITITNHELPTILLLPGLPQQGIVSSSINFYYFFNTIRENIRIALTPKLGSPYLLISTHLSATPNFYKDLPSSSSFIWSSLMSSDKYSISINSTDPNYCIDCYYLVGVGCENTSNYLINVNNDLNIRVLQRGVPYKSTSQSRVLEIYSFQTTNDESIYISISEYSGIVDFYVSDSVSSSSSNWRPASGHKFLVISPGDPSFKVGVFYVKIETFTESSIYSILVYTPSNLIKLIDTWPIHLPLSIENSSDITFTYTATGNVYCLLESLTDDFFPIVFASHSDAVSDVLTQYNYTGTHLPMTFTLSPGEKLLLTVRNYRSTYRLWGEFSIYCTCSFYPSILALGQVKTGVITESTPELRYEINVPTKSLIKIFVVPCLGDVEIKIFNNWDFQSHQDEFAISRLHDGVLFGDISNAFGKYYISVANANKTAAFQIHAENKTVDRAYPGNNGDVMWSLIGDSLRLAWKPVEYLNKSSARGVVNYKVGFTEDETLEIRNYCEVLYGISLKQMKIIGSTQENSLKLTVPTNAGFINVVGEILNESNIALRYIVYNRFRFEGDLKNLRYNKMIIALEITVVIILAAAVVYSCVKYKKAHGDIIRISTQSKEITVGDDSPVKIISKKYLEFN